MINKLGPALPTVEQSACIVYTIAYCIAECMRWCTKTTTCCTY